MGNCNGGCLHQDPEQPLAEPPADAYKLEPPKSASELEGHSFRPPGSRRYTRSSRPDSISDPSVLWTCPPAPADYGKLEIPSLAADFTAPLYVSPSVFYNLLQRKCFEPKYWVLYDLQTLSRFRLSNVKFSINLAQTDSLDSTIDTKKIKETLESQITTFTKVLLYSNSPNPRQCPIFYMICALLKDLTQPPEAVIILNTHFHNLCNLYPPAHFQADRYPIASTPIEILYKEQGFSLYIGDARIVRHQVNVLHDVYDIRVLINLSEESLAGEFEIVCEPRRKGENVKDYVHRHSKLLRAYSDYGVPVMLVYSGDPGNYLAAVVAAFYMHNELFGSLYSEQEIWHYLSLRCPWLPPVQRDINSLADLFD